MPKHTNLVIQVAHMRDLERLGFTFEGLVAPGAKESIFRLKFVAALAGGYTVVKRCKEIVFAGLLNRGQ